MQNFQMEQNVRICAYSRLLKPQPEHYNPGYCLALWPDHVVVTRRTRRLRWEDQERNR